MLGGWNMGLMLLIWLVAFASVTWLIATWLLPKSGVEGRGETAAETVKRRYAEGQLDRETYEQMLGDLAK